MKKDHKECWLALKCSRYCAEDPCEKPSRRFMKRPVCFISDKTGLISKFFGKIAECLLHIGGLEE